MWPASLHPGNNSNSPNSPNSPNNPDDNKMSSDSDPNSPSSPNNPNERVPTVFCMVPHRYRITLITPNNPNNSL